MPEIAAGAASDGNSRVLMLLSALGAARDQLLL